MSEPTLTEAFTRIKKELAGAGILVAALGGGSGWFGYSETQDAETHMVQFYEQELGRCRMRVADQKTTCLELLTAERDNTAQWRAQCGG